MVESAVHQKLKRLLIDHSERGAPMAFAGREQIIRSIENVVESLREKLLEGQTFVIGGPPGAGKTSLVRELAKKLNTHCLVRRKVPDEMGAQALWHDLAVHLTGISSEGIRAAQYRERYGEGGLNTLLQAQGGFKEATTLDPLPLTDCDQILKLTDKPLTTPVVVCVDEVQNVEKNSPAANLIEDLHTQAVAPVVLVCAGLANVRDRLYEIGLTRPIDDHVISLGVLAPEETLSAARQSLVVIAATGVAVHNQTMEALAEKIARASDDWPRHLTCYLRGVCESLLEERTPSFESFDVDKALERGGQHRQSYDEDRIASSRLPAGVLAALYERLSESPISERVAANILHHAVQSDTTEEGPYLRQDFPEIGDAFDQALRSGLLTLRGNDTCEVPIPSMASFIMERARTP